MDNRKHHSFSDSELDIDHLVDTIQKLQISVQEQTQHLTNLNIELENVQSQLQLIRKKRVVAQKVQQPSTYSGVARRSYAQFKEEFKPVSDDNKFGYKIGDTVTISNNLYIDGRLIGDVYKTGPVDHFTKRFIVIKIFYKFHKEDREYRVKLVSRELQNVNSFS